MTDQYILDTYPIFIYIVVGLLGLLIGSFLNVVAIRIPMKRSISFPPSHCVNCSHRLGVMDLIPVFSYLTLRGKCRYCKQSISMQYPLVEAVTTISFILLYGHFGLTAETAVALLLATILIATSVTDLLYRLIPDRIVFTGVALAIILRLLIHPLPLWNYAVAAIAGSAFLLLISIVSRGGMGGGDIKLYLFIGLILGLSNSLLSIFVASLLGTIYGIIRMIVQRKLERKQAVPFGPFIAVASVVTYLWGNDVIHWYMNLI